MFLVQIGYMFLRGNQRWLVELQLLHNNCLENTQYREMPAKAICLKNWKNENMMEGFLLKLEGILVPTYLPTYVSELQIENDDGFEKNIIK